MNMTIFFTSKVDYKKKNDYLILVAKTGRSGDDDIVIFIKKIINFENFGQHYKINQKNYNYKQIIDINIFNR